VSSAMRYTSDQTVARSCVTRHRGYVCARSWWRWDERLKSMRVLGAAKMQTYVRQHVQGHLQYYGVSGNSRGLRSYVPVPPRKEVRILGPGPQCTGTRRYQHSGAMEPISQRRANNLTH
jgi:hypothetical protein